MLVAQALPVALPPEATGVAVSVVCGKADVPTVAVAAALGDAVEEALGEGVADTERGADCVAAQLPVANPVPSALRELDALPDADRDALFVAECEPVAEVEAVVVPVGEARPVAKLEALAVGLTLGCVLPVEVSDPEPPSPALREGEAE